MVTPTAKSLKNLVPFEKGISGNPAGRKKGAKTFKTRLREFMEYQINYKDLEGGKKRMRVDEALCLALLSKALFKKDIKAIELIRDEIAEATSHNKQLGETQILIVQRAIQRFLPPPDKIKEIRND